MPARVVRVYIELVTWLHFLVLFAHHPTDDDDSSSNVRPDPKVDMDQSVTRALTPAVGSSAFRLMYQADTGELQTFEQFNKHIGCPRDSWPSNVLPRASAPDECEPGELQHIYNILDRCAAVRWGKADVFGCLQRLLLLFYLSEKDPDTFSLPRSLNNKKNARAAPTGKNLLIFRANLCTHIMRLLPTSMHATLATDDDMMQLAVDVFSGNDTLLMPLMKRVCVKSTTGRGSNSGKKSASSLSPPTTAPSATLRVKDEVHPPPHFSSDDEVSTKLLLAPKTAPSKPYRKRKRATTPTMTTTAGAMDNAVMDQGQDWTDQPAKRSKCHDDPCHEIATAAAVVETLPLLECGTTHPVSLTTTSTPIPPQPEIRVDVSSTEQHHQQQCSAQLQSLIHAIASVDREQEHVAVVVALQKELDLLKRSLATSDSIVLQLQTDSHEHISDLTRIITEKNTQMDALRQQHDNALQQMVLDQDARITSLRQQYEATLQQQTAKNAAHIATLQHHFDTMMHQGSLEKDARIASLELQLRCTTEQLSQMIVQLYAETQHVQRTITTT